MENGYLNLIWDILENGTDKEDRTGVGSRSVFGRQLRFDLSEGFPLITTRKTSFKIAFEETMFFLRGDTNTKLLEEKGINIWKGNTTREFLDSRGLYNLPEGNMGKGYGYQWRNFGKDHINAGSVFLENRGVDQVMQVLHGLEKDPYSRRHIISAWNPQQLNQMALPPCHILHQYQVMDGKLNSCFFMRSNDVYLGLPYNIASYAFINILFSEILGLVPGDLVYMGGDVHLYQNQIENAKKQVQREPLNPPKIQFKKKPTLDNFLTLQLDDVELIGYEHHPPLPKVEMAV